MYFSIKYLDIKKGACGPGNVYSTFANNNFLKRTTDNNEKLHNPQIFECPHQLGCEKHTGTHRGVFLLYYVSQVVCSACLPKPVQSSATVSYNPVASWWPNPNLSVELFSSSNSNHKYLTNRMVLPPNSNTILGDCEGYIGSTGTGICERGFIILLNICLALMFKHFLYWSIV